jgi:hypothetical protein
MMSRIHTNLYVDMKDSSFICFLSSYIIACLTCRKNRHFYEIIREGAPCQLYFDIEFEYALNMWLLEKEKEKGFVCKCSRPATSSSLDVSSNGESKRTPSVTESSVRDSSSTGGANFQENTVEENAFLTFASFQPHQETPTPLPPAALLLVQPSNLPALTSPLTGLAEFGPSKYRKPSDLCGCEIELWDSIGHSMIETLILELQDFVHQEYGIHLPRSAVLDLDSSSTFKFSRHLIVHLREENDHCKVYAFLNNDHAGRFVHSLCVHIENKVLHQRVGNDDGTATPWASATAAVASSKATHLGKLFVIKSLEKDKPKSIFIDQGVYTKNR